MADMEKSIVVTAEDKASGALHALITTLSEFAKGVAEGARAEYAAIKANKDYADSIKDTKGPVGGLISELKGLAVQLYAAQQVAEAFVNSVKQADALDDLAEKTGKSAAELKELSFAAGISGSSLDGLLTGLSKLGRSAAASEDEVKKQAQAFEDLGISVKDAEGNLKSSDTLFLELADTFKGLEDGPEKSALAFRLFGSEAKNLLPMLNKGADGIKALRAEAQELGRQSPDEFNKFAAASASLFDNIDRLNIVFGSFIDQLNADVVPVLDIVLAQIVESAKEGGLLRDVLDGLAAIWKNALVPAVKLGAIALDGFTSTIKIVGKGIGALAAAISSLASGDIEGAKQAFASYQEDVAKVAKEHTDFQEKMALLGHEAVKLADTADKKVRPKITGLGKSTREAKNELLEFVEKLKETNAVFNQDESVKQRVELLAKYNKALKEGIDLNLARKILLEGEAQIKLNKALRDGAAAQEAFLKAKGAVENLEIDTGLMELEASLIGKTDAEREKAIQTYKDEAEVRRLTNGLTEEAAGALSEEIRALQKRNNIAKAAVEEDKKLQALTKDTMVSKNKQALEDVSFLYAAFTAGKIKSEEEYVQAVEQVLNRLKDKNKEVADESTIFWQEAAKGIQNSLSTFFFNVMQGKLDDLAGSIKNVFDQLIANALAAKAAGVMFGSDFQKTGNFSNDSLAGMAGSYISGLFGGYRAVGGDVMPGRTYVINDTVANPKGERFVPREPGTILPAGSNLGSNQVINVNISALDGADAMRVLRNNSRELTQLVIGTSKQLNIK